MTNEAYERLQQMADKARSFGAPTGNRALWPWAQSATGQQFSPDTFPSRARADEIEAGHSDVTAKVSEAMAKSAEVRQKVLVPAHVDLTEFDHYTAALAAGSGPDPWKLIEPLWNDLTWWYSAGFDQAGRWKQVEETLEKTQKFVDRIRHDGNPPHRSVPSGWPTPVRELPTTGAGVQYDWNTPSGIVYRSQVDRQIDALTALNSAAGNLNDAVGAVSTFTAFLAAAALAVLAALSGFVVEWIAALVRMIRTGEGLVAELAGWTARLAQLAERLRAAQGAWSYAGRAAAAIIDGLVAAIRFVQQRIKDVAALLQKAVTDFIKTLKWLLGFVLGSGSNFAITIDATKYALGRATTLVRKVNIDADEHFSRAFGTGHWPNPCIDLEEYQFRSEEAGRFAGRGGSRYMYPPFGQVPGEPAPPRSLP